MEGNGPLLYLLLVLLLILVSWLLGYYARARVLTRGRLLPDPDYFVGLNYLLNDEPDDAIDVFIAALEINAATFDTHLALGKLLRRRGKVDRSIAHYQDLLASRSFNSRQVAEIRIQLLRSYIAAGLLDRAEQLLLELRQTSSMRSEGLRLAIMLYQTEKEWRLALDAAGELLRLAPAQHRHDLLMQMTHFHCELAELAQRQADPARAREELRQALALFKGNIRVYLLLARIENDEGFHQEALSLLHKALQVEPSLFAEVLPDLRKTLELAGETTARWLERDYERELGNEAAYRADVAQQLLQAEGAPAAITYLLQQLGTSPSLPLLQQALQIASDSGVLQDTAVDAGAGVLALHLQSLPRYRCEHCGFELRNLHWSCPGCSCWGMVKSIDPVITSGPEAATDPNT